VADAMIEAIYAATILAPSTGHWRFDAEPKVIRSRRESVRGMPGQKDGPHTPFGLEATGH